MEDYVRIADCLAPRGELPALPVAAGGSDTRPRRRDRRARAHLAPWQAKLARELMVSQVASGLALGDIAERLNISVNHFIKAFRETEGVAPYHWYMQRRIAQAATLLCDDTMSLSKVADACGFADQSHFTKAFTRLVGVSPGRWRRRAAAGPSGSGGAGMLPELG